MESHVKGVNLTGIFMRERERERESETETEGITYQGGQFHWYMYAAEGRREEGGGRAGESERERARERETEIISSIIETTQPVSLPTFSLYISAPAPMSASIPLPALPLPPQCTMEKVPFPGKSPSFSQVAECLFQAACVSYVLK